jgi:hypothetical protein
MKIPISKIEVDEKVIIRDMGIRRWRWVLSLEWGWLGIDRMLQHGDNPEWRWIGTWLGLSITKHFKLGPWHGYYDGPHCSFSLGWLHIIWEGDLE